MCWRDTVVDQVLRRSRMPFCLPLGFVLGQVDG